MKQTLNLEVDEVDRIVSQWAEFSDRVIPKAGKLECGWVCAHCGKKWDFNETSCQNRLENSSYNGYSYNCDCIERVFRIELPVQVAKSKKSSK